MARRKKNKSAVVDELKNQLLIQAERLGIRHRYTPLWFVEQKILAVSQVLSEFYAERANLEYELNMMGSDKKELLVKLEKLHSYIRKGEAMRQKYADKFGDMMDKDYSLTENELKLKSLKEIDVEAVA